MDKKAKKEIRVMLNLRPEIIQEIETVMERNNTSTPKAIEWILGQYLYLRKAAGKLSESVKSKKTLTDQDVYEFLYGKT